MKGTPPHQHHHHTNPQQSWSRKAQIKSQWMQSDIRLVGWESRAVGTVLAPRFYSLVIYSADPITLFSITLRCWSQGGKDKTDYLSTVTASSPPPESSAAHSAPQICSKITGYIDSISQDVPQPTALSVAGQMLRKALCKNAVILKKDSYLDDLPSYLAQAVIKLYYSAGIIKTSI